MNLEGMEENDQSPPGWQGNHIAQSLDFFFETTKGLHTVARLTCDRVGPYLISPFTGSNKKKKKEKSLGSWNFGKFRRLKLKEKSCHEQLWWSYFLKLDLQNCILSFFFKQIDIDSNRDLNNSCKIPARWSSLLIKKLLLISNIHQTLDNMDHQ